MIPGVAVGEVTLKGKRRTIDVYRIGRAAARTEAAAMMPQGVTTLLQDR
jgi:hypothetical protein